MDIVNDIFDKMDHWRNLPNYQLERRSDIFFAVYLKPALERKYNVKLKDEIIPEFPVHIGTIYPEILINKSFKIDYVAFAENYSESLLIELKTDVSSRRDEQDRYLKAAAQAGMTNLIKGLIKIFQATNAKRKYFHLFRLLESAGIIELPKHLYSKVFSTNMVGINSLISEVIIIKEIEKSKIVYLQPNGKGKDVINFDEFAALISTFDDPITRRFSESLKKWSTTKAGDTSI